MALVSSLEVEDLDTSHPEMALVSSLEVEDLDTSRLEMALVSSLGVEDLDTSRLEMASFQEAVGLAAALLGLDSQLEEEEDLNLDPQ